VSSSNDLTEQLQNAFEDSRQGYLIGFYAPNWDGKFHALRVKVHHPGATARTRQGYYAVDNAAPDPAARLNAALANAVDALEIPMQVAAAKQGPAAHVTIAAKAQVPGGSLAFENTPDGWAARVKLVYVQRDAAGRRIWQYDQDLAIKLSEGDHAKALTAGVRFTTPIALRDDAKQLRVVLQDRESGAVGSVTMELNEIPEQR
jgi:isocitrate lyase